jgi:predicted RNA binding protein YcfA (HicA-like mRNA interferase family)
MKVRDVISRLEADGWRLVRQKGSHRAFKHPNKPMIVTVPGNWNDDLPVGTLKSILKKGELLEP